MKIYTITCFKRFGESREAYSKNRQRTWGFYVDFAQAEKAILENWTDMFEMGYYDVALIEEVPEGVCEHATAKQWYAATYAARETWEPRTIPTPVVVPTNPPEWAHGTCNWSMS